MKLNHWDQWFAREISSFLSGPQYLVGAISSSTHQSIPDWESLSTMREVTAGGVAEADMLEVEKNLRSTIPIHTVIASITLATDIYWLMLKLSRLCAQHFMLMSISSVLRKPTLWGRYHYFPLQKKKLTLESGQTGTGTVSGPRSGVTLYCSQDPGCIINCSWDKRQPNKNPFYYSNCFS